MNKVVTNKTNKPKSRVLVGCALAGASLALCMCATTVLLMPRPTPPNPVPFPTEQHTQYIDPSQSTQVSQGDDVPLPTQAISDSHIDDAVYKGKVLSNEFFPSAIGPGTFMVVYVPQMVVFRASAIQIVRVHNNADEVKREGTVSQLEGQTVHIVWSDNGEADTGILSADGSSLTLDGNTYQKDSN